MQLKEKLKNLKNIAGLTFLLLNSCSQSPKGFVE